MVLEIVVPEDAVPAETAARLVRERLDADGVTTAGMKLYHSPVDTKSLLVGVRGRKSLHIDGPGYDVHLASVKNHRLGFLTADLALASWTSWIRAVSEAFGLTTARLHNREYDYWQNADDPLEYETASRDMNGLPMRSNDLPPPLNKMLVDTSRNPGRRVLRQGYVEAIGHRMWLGPAYFARVPRADRDAIVNAGWLQVTERENGILEVVASDEPFTDDSTADIQDRLRRLLFPTTA